MFETAVLLFCIFLAKIWRTDDALNIAFFLVAVSLAAWAASRAVAYWGLTP